MAFADAAIDGSTTTAISEITAAIEYLATAVRDLAVGNDDGALEAARWARAVLGSFFEAAGLDDRGNPVGAEIDENPAFRNAARILAGL